MSAWITDRLPTAEDADRSYQSVFVARLGKVYSVNYNYIQLGEPWQPITYPEPYVKPKRYVLKDGWIEKDGRCLYWGNTTPEERKAVTDELNRLEEGV